MRKTATQPTRNARDMVANESCATTIANRKMMETVVTTWPRPNSNTECVCAKRKVYTVGMAASVHTSQMENQKHIHTVLNEDNRRGNMARSNFVIVKTSSGIMTMVHANAPNTEYAAPGQTHFAREA